jgi:hypothetical protein
MGPDEENCDSTLGGLYADCGQADGGSAISPPADPFLGTAEDPTFSRQKMTNPLGDMCHLLHRCR